MDKRTQEYIESGTTTHVKHMGFELELAHDQICRALMRVPEAERAIVIYHLAPVSLRRAVRETMIDG